MNCPFPVEFAAITRPFASFISVAPLQLRSLPGLITRFAPECIRKAAVLEPVLSMVAAEDKVSHTEVFTAVVQLIYWLPADDPPVWDHSQVEE